MVVSPWNKFINYLITLKLKQCSTHTAKTCQLKSVISNRNQTSVHKLLDVIATCDPLCAGRGLHADHVTLVIIVGWIRPGKNAATWKLNYKGIICEFVSQMLTNQSLPHTLPSQFTTLQLAYPGAMHMASRVYSQKTYVMHMPNSAGYLYLSCKCKISVKC